MGEENENPIRLLIWVRGVRAPQERRRSTLPQEGDVLSENLGGVLVNLRVNRVEPQAEEGGVVRVHATMMLGAEALST